MGLSTAERNRRKRERKKRAKELERKRLEDEKKAESTKTGTGTGSSEGKPEGEGAGIEVEIEYVAEPLSVSLSKVQSIESSSGDGDQAGESVGDGNGEGAGADDSISAVLRRFHARAGASLVSDDDEKKEDASTSAKVSNEDEDSSDDDDEYPQEAEIISNRKLRERTRPTVAQLKNRVERADLVEAHDVCAADPDFLLFLKAVPSTVPVPRHWGRKRKYLQGKRGIEKAPFQLPDFIVKTGISEVRAKVDEDESGENAKRKNRSRVAPKMGALDVDYRTLHDAFFKHQNKRSIQEKLTGFGDLYYEGKEYESQKSSDLKVGIMTPTLRDALNMTDTSPPPWLMNMQRYGPPPSYPNLKIPGLNAPLPAGCSYGYHVNGWGKPPVDNFGRALYGGNPFDAPGSSGAVSTADWDFDASSGAIVTSDGKTIFRKPWGALPMAGMGGDDDMQEESSSDEESSDDDSSSEDGMVESDDEDEEEEEDKNTPQETNTGMESVVPESANDLRKQAGSETPLVKGAIPQSKQLYTVLHQTSVDKDKQAGAVFASDVGYVVPGGAAAAGTNIPEGMESVLSKAPLTEGTKRKHKDVDDDDENEDLGKKFKF